MVVDSADGRPGGDNRLDACSKPYPLIYLSLSMQTTSSRALRRLRLSALLVMLMLAGPSLAQAQGAYVPNGTNGLGFAAALSGNKLGLGPSLTVGYADKSGSALA